MHFEKSTKPCDIPYGVYHVDHDYINHIRDTNPNALDPNISDIYCGPVYHALTERGISGFFAPVDRKEYESHETFLMEFENGVLGDICDFKKMLPVVSDRFLTPANENEKFVHFCCKMKPMAEACADELISSIRDHRPCKTLRF